MIAVGRRLEWGVALVGLALAGVIVRHAHDPVLVALIVTISAGALIAWIAVQDLKTFTISDSAIVSIAILAMAYRLSASLDSDESSLRTALATGFDALLPGALLLVFREVYYHRKGFDGLGLGDVKLAGAGGLLVGTVGFSVALLSSSLMALAFLGLRQVLGIGRPIGRTEKLAFGAFLAPALWTVWVAEQWPMLLPYANR